MAFLLAIAAAPAQAATINNPTASQLQDARILYSSPRNQLVIAGILYFPGCDRLGCELWRSDGTTPGTYLVKDIAAGPSSSLTSAHFAAVNGWLYFVTSGNNDERAIWKSDGTAAGTVLVKRFTATNYLWYPQELTNVAGKLYFIAGDTGGQQGVWQSDGTAAGTILIKSEQFTPFQLIELDGRLFFFTNGAYVNGYSFNLWMIDGLTLATTLVKNIAYWPGWAPDIVYYPHLLVVYQRQLFFIACGFAPDTMTLWHSDGTSVGTAPVRNDTQSGMIYGLIEADGTLFFSADRELWKSNGTSAGTMLLKDVGGASVMGHARQRLFFVQDHYNLWKSDGMPDGTVMLASIFPYVFQWCGRVPCPPPTVFLQGVNDTLFYNGSNGRGGSALWKSDATPEGTVLVKDFVASTNNSWLWDLINVDGTVFFFANSAKGYGLWKSDGLTQGTVLVKEFSTWSDTYLPLASR